MKFIQRNFIKGLMGTKILLEFFFLLMGLGCLNATHIVGGEIIYKCLGNGQYFVTLKVYRDCLNGQAPFDDPAYVGVFTLSGTLVDYFPLYYPGINTVPFYATSPCFQAPPDLCVEEAIYSDIIQLPANHSGLILAYQRCCRNHTIVNLINPGEQGTTYVATIPPSNQIACNNSPYFVKNPPIVVCIGDTILFDHTAVDLDGDSLVYELCHPYQGADAVNPMPIPPNPPPYQPVVYAAPYNASYPLNSTPAISIHPHSGLLKFSPTQVGQYVIGVCVNEYRNGILISKHMRDFQVNVTTCLTNVVAGIGFTTPLPQNDQGVYLSCGDFEVNFQNLCQNASYFLWDFGVAGTQDISTLPSPTFTYPGSGLYTITLIANPNYFCADTTQVLLMVVDKLNPYFEKPGPQCLENNSFFFESQGNFTNQIQFYWNFGNQATPSEAFSSSAGPVQFQTWGTFPVTLTLSESNCTESYTDSVTIIGPMELNVSVDSAAGCAPLRVHFSNTASTTNAPVHYTWNFGYGNFSSNQPKPIFIYPGAGIFDVTVTLDDSSGCNASITQSFPNLIHVYPRPEAGFKFYPDSVSVFLAKIQFINQSNGSTSVFYDFGDGNTSFEWNPLHEYIEGGRFPVYQIVGNQFGCIDSALAFVTIFPEFTFFLPNAFTPNDNDLNEYFLSLGVGIEEFEMSIWNRWGECLFFTQDKKQSWNGRINNTGEICKQDTYLVYVRIKDVFGNFHKFYQPLHLIR